MKVKSAVKKVWNKRKAKVIPKGAIEFQLRAWTKAGLTVADLKVAKGLMQQHNFSNLYIIHGNGLLINGKIVIVSGPAGIGKSTISRKLEKQGKVQIIEDGSLVVGEKNGKWFMVETGLKTLNSKFSIIAKWIRKATFTDTTRYYSDHATLSKPKQKFLDDIVGKIAFRTAILFSGNKSRSLHEPRLFEVERVELGNHTKDNQPIIRVGSDLTVTKENILSRTNQTVPVKVFSTIGKRNEVRARIKSAILKQN